MEGLARRALSEAGRFNHLGTQEDKAEAWDLYREALDLWQQLERPDDAARALLNLGILEQRLGSPRRALQQLRRALALWEQQGNLQGQAQARMEIANAALGLGELTSVEDTYWQSLEDWRALGDVQGQARVLNFLGLTRARTAPDTAFPLYEEALGLFRKAGDISQEGVVLNNLGGLHSLLGEPGRAIERFEEALMIYRRLDRRLLEAYSQNNIAWIQRQTGQLQEALLGFQSALEIFKSLDEPRGEGSALNNLGLTWLRLGDMAKAREHLEQALEIRRAIEDRRGEAITSHNLGLVHLELGDGNAAEEAFEKALAMRQSQADPVGSAAALVTLGRAVHRIRGPETARRHLEKVLPMLEGQGNPWRLAEGLRTHGQILTAAGEIQEASRHLERALELYRSTNDDIGIGDTLLALARVERRRAIDDPATHLPKAYRHASDALSLLEGVRADVDNPDLRISYLAQHSDAFELTVGLAMDLHRLQIDNGWDARALELHERSRARSLLDLLKESGAGLRRGIDPELLARQRELLERLNAKVDRRRRHLSRSGDDERTERLAREILATTTALEGVENAIRRQSPQWGALTAPAPFEATALQALLDPNTLLLQYALGEERSYLWVVTDDGLSSHELPPRHTIEAAAREVHDALRVNDPRAKASKAQAVARLSEIVLDPVADRLRTQRLAIVADGALHYVPFAALPHPAAGASAEPLLGRHEIVALPSASALGLQRQVLAGRPAAPRALAAIADPVFGAKDPRLGQSLASPSASEVWARSGPALDTRMRDMPLERLAWSRWEAEAITKRLGDGKATLALDFDANLESVTGGLLRGHRIVHFATHGLIDGEHPELSSLVLSLHDAEGRPRPGHLRLPDILNLQLDADLVVLSGCRTALGPEIRGEGLIGLTRGFFAAGARRLVASLWRVQDRSTAELMDAFYRRLLTDGQTPSAALRAAQLELRAKPGYGDPYHWAAFAVYGDWR